MARWIEFFEMDDGPPWRLSMNRLCTFLATFALFVTFIPAAFLQYDTATTLATILAGLGGFSYAAGKMTGAYTQVRVEQARQGIPAPEVPAPLNPAITINTGVNKDDGMAIKSRRKR